MKLVYVRNKENGTTYVYESKYCWNPEKRQSRSRRVCIGKLDGEGNLIPSPRFSRPLPETIAHQGGAAAARPAKRLYFGGVYLLDQIGRQTGFLDDLCACFPEEYGTLFSLICFLILEGQAPLSRLEKWSRTHWHPAGRPLTAEEAKRLLRDLHLEAVARFLSLEEGRRPEAAPLPGLFPSGGVADPWERAALGMGFVVLAAMFLLSAVTERMRGNDFFKGWTAQRVFDRLDLIECEMGPDGSPEEGFVSPQEAQLLTELGVCPPEVSEPDRPAR